MNPILYRMPNGMPGQLTVASQATVDVYKAGATAFGAYGLPAKLGAGGTAIPMGAGDAAQQPLGFLVRPYPTQGNASNDPGATNLPPAAGPLDIMKRGYMTVKCNVGNPAVEGTVYMRVTASGGNTIIGGLEATADGANNIALTNVKWTGPKDSLGNAEIAFNI